MITPTQHAATSADGTAIGYLTYQPSDASLASVVLIQGSMATCRQYSALSQSLASRGYTVHTPDRRGRKLSPKPYTVNHSIDRDVEDLQAVLTATSATRAFGMSSGCMVLLEAARTTSALTHMACYEPPFTSDPGDVQRKGIVRLNEEIGKGDLAAGMFSAILASKAAPAFISYVPRFLGKGLASLAMQLKRGSDEDLEELVPSVRYDFNICQHMNDQGMDKLKEVQVKTLLLYGTESAAYFRQACRDLEGVIRESRSVQLKGLNHDGSWNSGNPEMVADELHKFFSS